MWAMRQQADTGYLYTISDSPQILLKTFNSQTDERQLVVLDSQWTTGEELRTLWEYSNFSGSPGVILSDIDPGDSTEILIKEDNCIHD
jgi:hypothetical protein